jgi:ribose transport system substrate-binding protein
MRKRRLVAMVTTVLLGLTGCAGGPARTSEAVAFLTANAGLAYAQEMSMGFGWGVAQVGGVTHTETGPAVGDTARQLAMFQKLTERDRAGVSVFTLSPELLAGSLAAAQEAGTPVIAVHSPPAPGSGVTLYVGNDNFALGALLADQLATRLPAWTNGVAVLGTSAPGAAALDQRVAGLRAELAVKLPGLRLLGPFDTKEEPAANREAWQVLARANPGARVMLGVGDDDAATLAGLRDRTGATWLAAGFGLDTRSLRAVQDGHLVLVSPESYIQGAVAGWLQAAHARTGRSLPRGWIVVSGIAVTPRIVGQILARQESAANRAGASQAQVRQMVTRLAPYLRPLSAVR